MKHKIIWDTSYQFAGARNDPGDPRPTEIEADKSETVTDANNYPVGLRFIKDDVVVATFFAVPLAVMIVDDIQE